VILAAVIASFVLGLGNDATTTNPQASFSFDYEETDSGSGDSVGFTTISHDGGDTIQNNELYIRGDGFYDFGGSFGDTGDHDFTTVSGENGNPVDTDQNDAYLGEAGSWPEVAGSGDDSAVVSGDRIYVGVNSTYELDVVYEAQEGQSSSTLASDDGPDA
jgi:hypothetical protein